MANPREPLRVAGSVRRLGWLGPGPGATMGRAGASLERPWDGWGCRGWVGVPGLGWGGRGSGGCPGRA